MKCDICGKEIIYKKDLIAGPLNPTPGVYIGALMGKNIKTYHKLCLKTLSFKGKLHLKKILPMSGAYGTAVVITPIVLFFIAFMIILLSKSSNKLWGIVIFLIVIIIGFEIPLIRLRLKIKKEYEDKLRYQ